MEELLDEFKAREEHRKTIIAWIKQKRIKQNVSITMMAERIGMDPSNLSKCEAGTRVFGLDEFIHYCGVLDHSLTPMPNPKGK
jgi:hypothetical protein